VKNSVLSVAWWQKIITRYLIEILGLVIAFLALLYGCHPFKLLGIIPADFARSLTAGVFGIGVNISVIKWLLDSNEYRRWKSVQYHTSRAIALHIRNIIVEIIAANHLYLAGLKLELPKTEPQFGTDILRKFKDLIYRCRIISLDNQKSMDKYRGLTDIVDKLVDSIYQNTKWDMEELQKNLIPRILWTPMDKDVQGMLTNLDLAIQRFYEIKVPKKQGVIPWVQISYENQLEVLIEIHELASTIEKELQKAEYKNNGLNRALNPRP
jgi:hypothetical protein